MNNKEQRYEMTAIHGLTTPAGPSIHHRTFETRGEMLAALATFGENESDPALYVEFRAKLLAHYAGWPFQATDVFEGFVNVPERGSTRVVVNVTDLRAPVRPAVRR